MNRFQILVRLQDIVDSETNDSVDGIKDLLVKLIDREMTQDVADVSEPEDTPTYGHITEDNIGKDLKNFLRLKRYKVKWSEAMNLWTASDPNHIGVLRGGSKTENGAWFACYKHYERSGGKLKALGERMEGL